MLPSLRKDTTSRTSACSVSPVHSLIVRPIMTSQDLRGPTPFPKYQSSLLSYHISTNMSDTNPPPLSPSKDAFLSVFQASMGLFTFLAPILTIFAMCPSHAELCDGSGVSRCLASTVIAIFLAFLLGTLYATPLINWPRGIFLAYCSLQCSVVSFVITIARPTCGELSYTSDTSFSHAWVSYAYRLGTIHPHRTGSSSTGSHAPQLCSIYMVASKFQIKTR
jgi:hypothetical protein